MNRSTHYLLLGIIFGLAAGAWAMRLYFDHTLGTWSPADRLLVKLSGDLKLNPDQREKVADILTDQKDRMEGLRRQWRIQVETLDREGEDRIAGVLLPSQMDLFMGQHDQIHGRMDRFLWTTNADPTALAIAPPAR